MEKPAVPTGTGNTWIIKLGVSGPDALRKEFERSKYNVSDRAVKMMRQKDYTLSLQERFATIAVLSVGDLGFDEGAEYRYACVRAVELGLDLCPPEAGPLLRKVYRNQPRGEKIRIAMTPIPIPSEGSHIFILGCGPTGIPWLGGDEICPDDFYDTDDLFAFIRPLLFKGSLLR